MKRAKFLLVGAFDRVNYGDLLFPIVFEKLVHFYRIDCEIEYFGTVNSDLSRFGGKPTKSLKKLLKRKNELDDVTLVLVGGEILGATWTLIVGNLLPKIFEIGLKGLRKLFGRGMSDLVSRKLVGVDMELPWIIPLSMFPSKTRIVYNSVGGVGVMGLSERQKKYLINSLNQSTFISVRDKITRRNLKNLEIKKPIHLFPDSVVVASQFFPPDELLTLASDKALAIISKLHNGFVCFQCAHHYVKGNTSAVAAELETMVRDCGLGLVLVPVGLATGHEDHIALQKIGEQLSDTAYALIQDFNIYDIMALIAHSKCYVGTSLHGAITAISYSVARVGYRRVKKLSSFMDTWDDPEMPQFENGFREISESVKKALNINESRIDMVRNRVIDAYHRGFLEMFMAVPAE